MQSENRVNELLTVGDLRLILKCGRDRCYALMKNPAFPAMKIAGRYYVNRFALEAWMQQYAYKQFIV